MERATGASVPSLDLAVVQRVLQEAPVSVAVLYGSHARGDVASGSDVDVAVGFDESVSSTDRTWARLDLIERLGAALETDRVDVVPLSNVSDALLREIHADGVLLVGEESDLSRYGDPEPPDDTHDERMGEFDDILAELERVV